MLLCIHMCVYTYIYIYISIYIYIYIHAYIFWLKPSSPDWLQPWARDSTPLCFKFAHRPRSPAPGIISRLLVIAITIDIIE